MTNNGQSKFLLLLLFISSLLLLISCSKSLGYGVILWAEKEVAPYQTGSLVSIYRESSLDKTYEVGLSSEYPRLEIAQWRVAFFSSRDSAEKYLKAIRPFVPKYAKSLLHGLPVRRLADRDSERIYRLGRDQVVKIVAIEQENVEIGNLTGNWYRILTEDGTDGFCFDSQLKLFDTKDEPEEEIDGLDPEIEAFLSQSWHPLYYRQMILLGIIDLEVFSPNLGIFPFPEDNRLEIVSKDNFISLEYSDITKSPRAAYLFEGTAFQVKFREEEGQIDVQYTHEGQLVRETYITVEEDISLLIEEEQTRRSKLFQSLLRKGPGFHSQSYGSITLDEAQGFLWRDFSKLVPHVIPNRAVTRGKVDFPIHLGPALKNGYQGIMSFQFKISGSPEGKTVHFLYQFTGEGMKLIYVPESDIKDSRILKAPVSPLVLFFSGLN